MRAFFTDVFASVARQASRRASTGRDGPRAWGAIGQSWGNASSTATVARPVRARGLAWTTTGAGVRSGRWGDAGRRGIRTSAGGCDRASSLSEALLREMKHENEAYEPSDVARRGPPTPFTVNETDGDAEVSLSRTYGEDEEVHVTFVAQEEPYDENEDEDDSYDSTDDDSFDSEDSEEYDDEDDENDEDKISIDFNVVVSKSSDESKHLEFDCVTDGEFVEIKSVIFEEYDDETPLMGTPYSGPNFEDLEETVQDKFYEYLEERGINSDLANYIVEAHLDKEQREYTNWLEKVATFVKTKPTNKADKEPLSP